jgi:integrase
MARVFRQQYTRPIPPDAQHVTVKNKKGEPVPAVRFKGSDGKTVTAPVVQKGKGAGTMCRVLSPNYAGHVNGQRVTLCPNKQAAEVMLSDLIRKAARGEAGMNDPFEKHSKRPLAEHLAEWETFLLADGATPKHVRQTVACARRVIGACKFRVMAAMDAYSVQQYLADLREQRRAPPQLDADKAEFTKKELAAVLGVKPSALPSLVRRHRLEAAGNGKARRYPRATAEALQAIRSRGRSIKTSNLYLDAIKGFAAWLVQNDRMAKNPLADLSGGNVKLDRRHDRRALRLDELRSVLDAAAGSDVTFRGLSGTDRNMLYLTACATGFRAEELACLRPESFDLDAEPPVAVLGAIETKNRKGATQPLQPDVAAALRGYMMGRPAGVPLWPGLWWKKGAEMLRIDLDAAGVPYAVEGPDGPLYADFHALRHSYIALLEKSGATLKEAMQLARHSDPKLTMAVYGRAQLHDLGRAVERLPDLMSGPMTQTAAATGTDGPYTLLTQTAGEERGTLRILDGAAPSACEEGDRSESLISQGVEEDRGGVRTGEENSPNVTLLELVFGDSRALLFGNHSETTTCVNPAKWDGSGSSPARAPDRNALRTARLSKLSTGVYGFP